MARIAGIDLPPNKRVEIGLTSIYGVGRSRAIQVLEKAEVPAATKVKDLTEDEARRIRKVIQDEGRVEGDLRKEMTTDIKRLMEIAQTRTRARARAANRLPARRK
jgi:small subunit ribosomal protein S13